MSTSSLSPASSRDSSPPTPTGRSAYGNANFTWDDQYANLSGRKKNINENKAPDLEMTQAEKDELTRAESIEDILDNVSLGLANMHAEISKDRLEWEADTNDRSIGTLRKALDAATKVFNLENKPNADELQQLKDIVDAFHENTSVQDSAISTCNALLATYEIQAPTSTEWATMTCKEKTLWLKSSKKEFISRVKGAEREFGGVVILAANILVESFNIAGLPAYPPGITEKSTAETRWWFEKGREQFKSGMRKLQDDQAYKVAKLEKENKGLKELHRAQADGFARVQKQTEVRMASLQAQVTEAAILQSTVNTLKMENEKLTASHQTLATEAAELRLSVSTLKLENEELTISQQAQDAQAAKLRLSFGTLKLEKEELDTSQQIQATKATKLQSTINALEKKKEELTELQQAQAIDIAMQQINVATLAQTNRGLEVSMAAFRNLLTTTAKTYNLKPENLDELQQLQHLSAILKALRDENAEMVERTQTDSDTYNDIISTAARAMENAFKHTGLQVYPIWGKGTTKQLAKTWFKEGEHKLEKGILELKNNLQLQTTEAAGWHNSAQRALKLIHKTEERADAKIGYLDAKLAERNKKITQWQTIFDLVKEHLLIGNKLPKPIPISQRRERRLSERSLLKARWCHLNDLAYHEHIITKDNTPLLQIE